MKILPLLLAGSVYILRVLKWPGNTLEDNVFD